MSANRDLLVVSRQHMLSQQQMEREVSMLHELLFQTERSLNFYRAHEIINVNRRRIISDLNDVKKIFRLRKQNDAFVFCNNKN